MRHYLCSSRAVLERATGYSFKVVKEGRIWPAFTIRFEGKIKGYLNVCAHAGLRLEGGRGQFFGRDGQHLVCTSHGAFFEPDTGQCTRGPCAGLSLIPLSISEEEGDVYLIDEHYKYQA